MVLAVKASECEYPFASTEFSPRKETCSPTRETSSRKKITFSSKVMIKQTLHCNDMDEETRNQYWMTEDEQVEIKDHCRTTVRMMMHGDSNLLDGESSDFCSRGLESRTRKGAMEKKQRKDEVRRTVLYHDQLQKEEGVFDAEYLALLSASKSRESRMIALARASGDAQEAREYLQQEIHDAKDVGGNHVAISVR